MTQGLKLYLSTKHAIVAGGRTYCFDEGDFVKCVGLRNKVFIFRKNICTETCKISEIGTNDEDYEYQARTEHLIRVEPSEVNTILLTNMFKDYE